MSTADLLGNAESNDQSTSPPPGGTTPDAVEEFRSLLRLGGWAGVAVFTFWLCQPILVSLLASSGASDTPDMAALEANSWVGGFDAVLFSAMGVASLVMVLAVWRAMRLRGAADGVLSTVGFAMALVGATAWFWVAGHGLSMYTSVGAGLADVSADSEIQAASLQASYLAVTAGLIVVGIGSIGWNVLLATTGRRAGLIGRPLSAVFGLFAAVPLYQAVVPFATPWPLIIAVLGSLVLGIALLLKSRKLR
ncbi:MAG TPA: hypothetical protein PLP55_05330 [Phycicoccus elongatus]|jgi:hypothetical protein|uniref:hypothetical protein n=1 Tax=Phycicoccus TaxID=367298 RepID=UPI001DE37F74|nr:MULTISPECIES: hypothetical protein [Phycicoccus]MCB1239256.1 hypothetical protein [Tetrasphaera sp.]MCB9406700.1 hypothetical protein [Tetrasphaera sp.]MCO5302517.1 hypothetical protein [Phycicoccus sp.]HPF75898.1 hypothetical protein [Phycicoccus elongatus]HPK12087.1 hypothetical protein [Phycicoccus elongatus]